MSEFNSSPEFEEKVREAVRTPSASPEFVDRLRNELARRPANMRSHFVLKPAWVVIFLIIALALVASAPTVVKALKRLFGYVPGVGLVENTTGLRMLAEPVSVTREGVTLTIKYVLAYEDHVVLEYEADGVRQSYDHKAGTCGANQPADSFWSDADADLRLPDGSVIRRDYAGKYQFENRYGFKPIYAVSLPGDVTDLTFLLKCIYGTKLGVTPENWEIPFKLVAVPPGTVVGEPVIEVEPPKQAPNASSLTEEPSRPSRGVKMTLEKIVPTDSATIFYLSMDMENHDPSLVSVLPIETYVMDSQGARIQVYGNFPMQPFQYRTGSLLEYVSTSKPADGPLTLVVEKAVAYYAPLYVEPPQASPEEMSFTFDVGLDPQHGQVWDLDHQFVIAGYQVQINSARAVTWDDVKVPEYIDGSQGFDYGYQFAVHGDTSVKMNIQMDILADNCGFTVGVPFIPESSSLLNTQLCRNEYPKGLVTAYIREISVLMEGPWKESWSP